jgi:hypothetical protein
LRAGPVGTRGGHEGARHDPGSGAKRLPSGEDAAAFVLLDDAHAVVRLRVPDAEEPAGGRITRRAEPLRRGPTARDQRERVAVPFEDAAEGEIAVSRAAQQLELTVTARLGDTARVGGGGCQQPSVAEERLDGALRDELPEAA